MCLTMHERTGVNGKHIRHVVMGYVWTVISPVSIGMWCCKVIALQVFYYSSEIEMLGGNYDLMLVASWCPKYILHRLYEVCWVKMGAL